MSILQFLSILILWIAAGVVAALFFFSSGFRFEPRRERADVQEEVSERETA